MKVYAYYGDRVMMDLVAHFLGIATHHNINAAPSMAPVLAVLPELRTRHQSANRALR